MDGGYNMIMQPPFNEASMIEAPGGHTEFCSMAGMRYDVICDFILGVKKQRSCRAHHGRLPSSRADV